MKPPVEHVRVSAKGKDVLIKIKRNTGLEHWNEISRIAILCSLKNPTRPPKFEKSNDNSIDIEWRTFAGQFHEELAALIIYKAQKDGININQRDALGEYFRNHLERGLLILQNIKSISSLYHMLSKSQEYS